jgi:hypothetical protein
MFLYHTFLFFCTLFLVHLQRELHSIRIACDIGWNRSRIMIMRWINA